MIMNFHFDKKKISKKVIAICLVVLTVLAMTSFIVFNEIKAQNLKKSNEANNAAVKGVETEKSVVTTPAVAPKVVTPVIPKKAVVPAPVVKPTPKPVPMSCTSSFNSQFLVLINNYRKSKGLKAVSVNTLLNNSACGHSTWMSKNNTLTHTGANGSTPWDRCKAAGTNCTGEIVAMNSDPSTQNLFDQWKGSHDHNAIMLGNYTQIGMGLSGWYATVDFR